MVNESSVSSGPSRAGSLLACLVCGTIGVFQFELKRSLLPTRLLGWGFLVMFPVILMAITNWQVSSIRERPDFSMQQRQDLLMQLEFGFSIAMFLLIPQLVVVLGLLLWATPIVNAELEAQSWIYSIVRPVGKVSTVLGKYLVAVLWTSSAGIVAATASVAFAFTENYFQLWWTMVRLIVLASATYGSLYVLIGTLFQRRSMVIAIVYTMIVEVALSYVPASINKFTVGFRLKSLMAIWQDLQVNRALAESNFLVDVTGQSHHLLALAAYGFILLALALVRVWYGEYPLQPEAN